MGVCNAVVVRFHLADKIEPLTSRIPYGVPPLLPTDRVRFSSSDSSKARWAHESEMTRGIAFLPTGAKASKMSKLSRREFEILRVIAAGRER